MTAGLEVRNTHNSVQINERYKNLMLMRKIRLSDLPPTAHNYYQDRHIRSLTLLDGEELIAVNAYVPELKGMRIYSNYPNERAYIFDTNKTASVENLTVYIYGYKHYPAAHGAGMQVFDAEGNIIFNSQKKYLKVLSFANDFQGMNQMESGFLVPTIYNYDATGTFIHYSFGFSDQGDPIWTIWTLTFWDKKVEQLLLIDLRGM